MDEKKPSSRSRTKSSAAASKAGNGAAEPAATAAVRGAAAARPTRARPAPRASAPLSALALLDRAAAGQFPSTVYLEGPDEAVKTAFLAEFRRLWAVAVPESPRANVLRPDESEVDAILAAYQNVSLFSPRELSIVFQMEKLGRSETKVKALVAGLALPAGGSCLVLVEGAADNPRKTLDPLRAACSVRVDAQPPPPAALPALLLEWGRRQLAASSASAEPGALEALIETCEQGSLTFFNEVGKLATLGGAAGVVTRAHVQALIAPRIGADMAEFLMAVAAGDVARAAQRLERLLAAGENEGSVLWALAHLVSASFTVTGPGYSWAKWKPASLALARRQSAAQRARALDAVYRAEAAWKGGRADVLTALEQATREVAAS